MRVRLMLWMRTFLVTFAGYFPRPLAGPLSKVLGALAFKLDKRGRRRALRQMDMAKVGSDETERTALIRKMYRHLALTILETLWISKHMNRALGFVTFEGTEHLDAAFAKGKGVVALSMHLGNWELSGVAMGLAYPGTGTIVREQLDDGLDKILSTSRRQAGLTLFPNTRDQGPAMAMHLAQNRVLGILMDVYASRKHPPIPFLGVPTPTFVGPADLLRATGATPLFFHIIRLKPYRHVLTISPIHVSWTQDREKDLLEATTLFNNMISDRIRQHPDQWLWIQKRWKDLSHEEEALKRQEAQSA